MYAIGLILLIAFGAYLGVKVSRLINGPRQLYHWPAPPGRVFPVEVVGESFNMEWLVALMSKHGAPRRQPSEQEHVATLVPYHSPMDANAVRVEIGGRPVGHLSRRDAPLFRAKLAALGRPGQSTTCGALVGGGGTDRSGEVRPIGVWLALPPFR